MHIFNIDESVYAALGKKIWLPEKIFPAKHTSSFNNREKIVKRFTGKWAEKS